MNLSKKSTCMAHWLFPDSISWLTPAILICFLVVLAAPIVAQESPESPASGETYEAALDLDSIQAMALELKYLDEVLTNSVLSYAFSLDEKWFLRYQEYEPQLGAVIDTLIMQGTVEESQLIESIHKENSTLVALELSAIEKVQAGDGTAAMTIVSSPEYHNSKTAYLAALDQYIGILEQRMALGSPQSALLSEFVAELTEEESKWASTHTVTVGVETWLPIIDQNENGELIGLAGAIVAQIAAKTGLQLKIVDGQWQELLDRFQQGQIDILPATYMSAEREQYGHFSKPYLALRQLYYVRSTDAGLQTPQDLATSTIAVPRGFATLAQLKAAYPHITIFETATIDDSIDAVLAGSANAMLGSDAVVEQRLETRGIGTMRAIDEDVFDPASLHIFTSLDKPLLQSIVEKGLDSLKSSDLMQTNSGWLQRNRLGQASGPAEEGALAGMMWNAVALVVVLLVVGGVVTRLVLKADEKQAANGN